MKKQTILTSAVAVAAATVLAWFFGFMREVTLAATYGASDVSDAFIAHEGSMICTLIKRPPV